MHVSVGVYVETEGHKPGSAKYQSVPAWHVKGAVDMALVAFPAKHWLVVEHQPHEGSFAQSPQAV